MANEFKVRNGLIVNQGITGTTLSATTVNVSNDIYSGGTNLTDVFSTSDLYTTGTTLVGTTLYFNRNDTLSAYTADLSSLGGATELNDLTDVTTALPSTPTEADDSKILFYDHDISQWTTDDAVTHGTVVINAKKDSAGTIAKGLPVYLVGFDSDLHTVELANANSGSTMPVIGFTSEQLDNSNSKHITTFGKLTGIDTSSTVSTLNPNGETWAVNDVLYMSTTTGGLTKVRPTGGTSLIQRIAKVLKVSATGGQIFVFNTARTAGLPNLTTDNVWVGDVNGIPQEVNKSTLGGNTLYSADDSLTGNRLFNLDSKSLTITGGTTNNATPINFEFGGTFTGYTRWDGTGAIQIKANGNTDPLKVYKKVDASNPNFVSKYGGGGHLGSDGGIWTVSQTYGGTSTRIELSEAASKHYHGSTEHHRIQLGGGAASGVYFWRNGYSSLGGFIVGGTAVVGTENISLQGSTLVNDKFEIQTTTNGFLMPRLTTAQMNAISSPDTHLVIFNTDLNALYRYNGSAWVAMSAGYGIISINDSSGNPTFYADLTAATTAVSAGGTITIHSDIALTAQWTIDKHLTVNMNGYTISFNSAGTDDTIYVNYAATQQQVFQFTGGGRIVRTGGTSSQTNSLAMHYQCADFLDMGSTQFHSDFGTAIYIQSAKQSIGGYIWAENTAVRTAQAKLIGCNIYSNNGDGLFSNSGSNDEVIRCFIQAPNGSGVKQAGTKDCYIIAGVDGVKDAGRDVMGNTIIATGKGIETGSGVKIVNNNVQAGTYGIQTGNSCEVTGNSVVAGNSAVYALTGSNIFGNPLLKSTGASAITGSVYKDVINNVIITTSNNASHHGVVTNNAQTHHILNNYIEVANAGAYGIVQTGGSTFVYSAGNTFKGMTTPLNLVNGNQQANTNDGYGNILIG